MKKNLAIFLGVFAVLQQIDDEEKKEKLKKRKQDGGFGQELRGASSSAHFMLS